MNIMDKIYGRKSAAKGTIIPSGSRLDRLLYVAEEWAENNELTGEWRKKLSSFLKEKKGATPKETKIIVAAIKKLGLY